MTPGVKNNFLFGTILVKVSQQDGSTETISLHVGGELMQFSGNSLFNSKQSTVGQLKGATLGIFSPS